MSPWYLAIDLGTGGAKVAVVGLDGSIRADAFASITTTYTDDGGAEQDPAAWWTGITAAARTAIGAASPAGVCAGIGITGQWGSTVPVDERGRALGPCLLWADDRGGPFVRDIVRGRVAVAGYDPRRLATWIRLTGGAPSTQGADPTGHVAFLAARRPEVHRAARAFLEPLDVLGARLTGRLAATPASMVGSWLTDNRPGAATVFAPELVALAHRNPTQLPELLPTGSVLGPVLPDAAAELGVAAGTPVVCGVPDLHTAALGAGAVADYAGHLAISTTAWVSAPVPFKRTDVLHQIASVPGLRAGSYLIVNNHETGGATLRWLRDQVLTADDGLGSPDLSYDALTGAARGSSAGAGGVIFTPWLKGERSPVEDRTLRASFLNLSLTTTRADLVRAVLEGVAYNARWLLEATERFAHHQLRELRILGGGARSDLWCQIHADVIGRPVHQVAEPMHVNVRGAAWFAALALGHLTDAELPRLVPAATRFDPEPAAGRVHAPVYREFTRLAKDQHGLYSRLNARH